MEMTYRLLGLCCSRVLKILLNLLQVKEPQPVSYTHLDVYKRQLSVSEIAGMTFSPFSAERWQISNDTSINYFLCAKKEARY